MAHLSIALVPGKAGYQEGFVLLVEENIATKPVMDCLDALVKKNVTGALMGEAKLGDGFLQFCLPESVLYI